MQITTKQFGTTFNHLSQIKRRTSHTPNEAGFDRKRKQNQRASVYMLSRWYYHFCPLMMNGVSTWAIEYCFSQDALHWDQPVHNFQLNEQILLCIMEICVSLSFRNCSRHHSFIASVAEGEKKKIAKDNFPYFRFKCIII